MIAGLCSVTFRSLPPEQVAAIAARCGLAAIEWGGDVHAPPGDLAAARRCAEASRRHGITTLSYGSYLAAGQAADAAPVLAAAGALGASHLRVWAGLRGLASAQAGAAAHAACAAELRALAAAAPMPVSVEYHPLTLSDGPDAANALLAAAAAPNLASLWQPDYGLLDPAVALAELAALGPRLSHLHVFHWTAEKERRPLAEGAALWRPVLRATARPGRIAFLEFTRGDDPEALAEDAATLRAWLAG